jgi:hypothetical protein
MEDATRIEQASTATGSVEMDTMPRPVVATVPQASRAARKSGRPLRIVATGENLLSAALPDLIPARRAERRERLRAAFRAAIDCALERRAQLFIIAGDLFASPAPENVDRAFVAQQLARLREASVTCVAVAGTRDAGGGDDAPYRLYESGGGLRFFADAAVLRPALVVIDGVRVALAGLSATPGVHGDSLGKASIEDPDDTLGRADLAILILSTPGEGVRETAGGQDAVSAASLAALPALVRLVIAGGKSHFGKSKTGKREIVAPGATERHGFEAPAESAGFAWIEINAEGATLIEHVRVEEQPRVELEIPTARLFPDGDKGNEGDDEADEEQYARSGVHQLPVLTPEEMAGGGGDDLLTPYAPPLPDADRERILARLLDTLKGVCRPDTMTRVRLTGPLTRRQFHQLPLAEALRFGQREAFSFELDSSALTVESARKDTPPGLVSLDAEIDRLVAEYRARLRDEEREARADLDAAASLLRGRLRASTDTDREAAR